MKTILDLRGEAALAPSGQAGSLFRVREQKDGSRTLIFLANYDSIIEVRMGADEWAGLQFHLGGDGLSAFQRYASSLDVSLFPRAGQVVDAPDSGGWTHPNVAQDWTMIGCPGQHSAKITAGLCWAFNEQRRRDWNGVLGGMQMFERPIEGHELDLARSIFLDMRAAPAVFLLTYAIWTENRWGQRGVLQLEDDVDYFRGMLRRQSDYTRAYLEAR